MRRNLPTAGFVSRAVTVLAIVAATSACGATTPPVSGSPSAAARTPPPLRTPGPSGPPVLGIDWARAASVEAPDNYNGDSKVPPYTGAHPILRIPGQAIFSDVTALPTGGFVAVGYVPPTWVPAAWTSPDGARWSLHPMGTTEFTFAVAVAAGADGTIVAVGRSGNSPVAWTTRDGVAWQPHSVTVLATDATAERMTTVVATDHGYLAGGSVGPELSERHARFWLSVDGIRWQPVRDDAAAFANSEVRAITRFRGGFVAVGVVGTAQKHSAAVAWTSRDGMVWTRVDDPSFAAGIAVSVVAAPFGGLVAVGSDLERNEAVVWTSADGRRWSRAPADASLTDPGFVWMTDVVAIGDEVIAVGGYQPLQRGTATSWVSRDGIHWDRARPAPDQEQAEFYAVAAGGPGVIAVGSFGQPDSYAPRVWLSPGR